MYSTINEGKSVVAERFIMKNKIYKHMTTIGKDVYFNDLDDIVKKTDYATEITSIKSDYVTKAALTSQLNDLKRTHLADEVKKVDDKVKKILLIFLLIKLHWNTTNL